MAAPPREFLDLQAALKGRYSLERELGRGGMGVVWLAHEVALDRPVALKLLDPRLAGQARLRERFLREARTAARLSHPHIVPIFAVDEVDHFVFFAMAHIVGRTLGERVRERGPLGHSQATRMMREVAWALAYAHAQGVVHRDVKPDNILLEDGSGRALVTDFGIAVLGPDGHDGDEGIIGTAGFMSPEQARGEAVDGRTDLWALGVAGFYAVSGRLPFEGDSSPVVLARQLTGPVPPVASVAPDLPASLAGPIDRCLRRDPDARWAGGEELAAALEVDTSVDRSLPVPLRVFIKRLRELSRTAPGVVAVLLVFTLPSVVGLVVQGFLRPALIAFGFDLAILAGVGAVAGGVLTYQARKLLKAGYRLEDLRYALERDVERRNEELAFEYGVGHTWYDVALKAGALGGLATALVLLVALAVTDGWAGLWRPFVVSFGGGLTSSLLAAGRERKRRDVPGERWLKILRSKAGAWLFRTAGRLVGLPTGTGTVGYRPTELAIGTAADRLFDELPREVKRSLKGLPETIRKLEADAQGMRRQVAELDGVLAEIGDDPDRAGAEERGRVRREVEATRDTARRRLTELVAALETVRLGLLRMHVGEASVESVTMELHAAREISADIEGLLEGRSEVERLLERRRRPAEGPSAS